MINLLKGNFYRLKKNKVLGLALIFTIFWVIFTITTKYTNLKRYNSYIPLEDLVFNYIHLFYFIITIFISIFLGDNSDNTTRNRIIIGQKRINIFIANFLTVLSISLFIYLLYTTLILIIGTPLFGSITISKALFIKKIINLSLIITSYVSIITFIDTIITDKVVITTIGIILFFILEIMGFMFYSRLSEPKYYEETIYQDGKEVNIKEKNPLYISPKTKKIVKFILPINPIGATLYLIDSEFEDISYLPIYSTGTTIFLVWGTIILFNKKEFK